MKIPYAALTKRGILLAALLAVWTGSSAFAQNKATGVVAGAPYSEGYITGNTLYVGGRQGEDPATSKLTPDIKVQTRNTLNSIKRIVEAAGYKMSDIVSVTVYITDLNDVAGMNEVYKSVFAEPRPTRATVQVAGLINGAKIEISAIAVKH